MTDNPDDIAAALAELSHEFCGKMIDVWHRQVASGKFPADAAAASLGKFMIAHGAALFAAHAGDARCIDMLREFADDLERGARPPALC